MPRMSERSLTAEVPHQPPAGKVEYWIELRAGNQSDRLAVRLPASGPVVARFRGEVPVALLVPHILAMFGAMLLAIGGLVLGPLVQRYAFGSLWTGWPVGEDVTDTKTLVAALAWLPATWAALRRGGTRWLVAGGWLVMMAVFLIPHSVRGSQIDWSAAGEGYQSTSTRRGVPPNLATSTHRFRLPNS